MRVIYKAPGSKPEIRDIPNTLEELQASVGGYIESYTFATDAAVICNEEGRLRGLPYNCRFLGVDFVGPILIAGIDGDEFADLDPETMGLLMRGLLMSENPEIMRVCSRCGRVKEVCCLVDGEPWCEECFEKAMEATQ